MGGERIAELTTIESSTSKATMPVSISDFVSAYEKFLRKPVLVRARAAELISLDNKTESGTVRLSISDFMKEYEKYLRKCSTARPNDRFVKRES